VSKIDDIKNRTKQKVITPAQAMIEDLKEENKEEKNIGRNVPEKVERKRVSFDLRVDLHKELKIQALMQEKNIYILIEEALEEYLKK
jgi:predicted HicB family RNase H-like nuclease